MVSITTEDDFRKWLSEDKHSRFASVLAFRAALRVLPLVDHPETRNQLTFIAFRLAFISWVAIAWPADEMPTRVATANAPPQAITPRVVNTVSFSSIFAIDTATDAAFASTTHDAVNSAVAAVRQAGVATTGFGAPAEVVWQDIEQDCGKIDQLDDLLAWKSILSAKLWPTFAEKAINDRWMTVQRNLNLSDENWQVWTEWYRRRVIGQRAGFAGLSEADDERICIAIALEGNAFWDRSAPEVNHDIRAMLDAARASPPAQDSSTETFGLAPDGRIGRAAATPGDLLDQLPVQVNLYNEFLKSFRTLDTCSDNEKGETLRGICNDLREILSPTVEAINYHLFWPRFHRLRIALKRHRNAKAGKDYSPHLLDDDLVYSLQEVVQNGNVLIVNQPKLLEKERQAQGPDLDSDDSAFANIRTVIAESAANSEVTHDDAAKDVAIAVEATDAPVIGVEGALGKQDGKKVQRNFMIVLMERFKSLPGKAAQKAGDSALTETSKKSVDLIFDNREAITHFFETQGDAAADWISHLL